MTTYPLSLGQRITNAADALQVFTLAEVATQVRVDDALQRQTARLRKLAQFDRDAYRMAKTSLPYVVGSVFTTGVRRLDMLEEATYFILDLDHCTGLDGRVPDAIRADLSVAMAFVSPSGEGLKLFFRLLGPCKDAKAFTMAYRNFAGNFGATYGFVQSVDLRTSDATRACFLAHDPACYHNPDSMPVDWQIWLPTASQEGNQSDDFDLSGTDVQVVARKAPADRPINEEKYRNVLQTMNPTAPVRREKQTYVPDELAGIQPAVCRIGSQLNWELTEFAPLNFGLKVVVKQGFRRAEVNVFYGKRGFSVVRSPKTGTDPTLADVLYNQLYNLLFPAPVVQQVPILEALCPN
ncbi:CRISPR-associated primase-polymerase type B [Fibrella arboris]|uniref:CRISPR-associated primase-polymerase type B n=1 Tax=Fibrella arboris TaxID=3242486 RepID=UPI00352230A0